MLYRSKETKKADKMYTPNKMYSDEQFQNRIDVYMNMVK